MASLTPKQRLYPALSTNKVPTIQSFTENPHITRSVSYNVAAAHPDPSNDLPHDQQYHHQKESTSGENVDQAGCDNMLKASLTGLLNAGEVKSCAQQRKVQNLLMQTQRDWRKQRRESLDQRDQQRKRMSFEGIEQGMKF